MEPNRPLISVVIPSLNSGKYIEETLDSILSQTTVRTQILVMDGGSTDGTINILKRYERHIYHWQSKPDGGQASAINAGFTIATGDVLAYQNADDYYLQDSFERVLDAFLHHPNKVIFGDVLIVDKTGRLVQEKRFTKFRLGNLVYEGMNYTSQSLFWRREVTETVGLFDETLVMAFDVDFVLRATRIFAPLHIGALLGAYRVYEEAKSARFARLGDKEYQEAVHKYYPRAPLDGPVHAFARSVFKVWRCADLILEGNGPYLLEALRRRGSNVVSGLRA